MKLKQDALEEMKKNFTMDELETIDKLCSGNLKGNSIKKIHLETFKKVINYLSEKLSWNVDEENFDDQTKSQTQISSEDVEENEEKKETCKFLKLGACHHGRSGKKKDAEGKICSFSHPPTCKNHELFGKCMNNKCKKLHFKLCRNYMSSLHCDYQNCKYLHPKRLRSNIQSQNSMSSQVYKGTPTYAQNVRKSFTPRIDLFDHSPYGHVQQPQKPAINENNEFHINNHHFPTIAQSVKNNFAPKMNSSGFLGQAIKPQQTVMKEENQVQPNLQDSFLEFMRNQREILRRLELLEIQNHHIQNPKHQNAM